jgi:hypothetical protein
MADGGTVGATRIALTAKALAAFRVPYNLRLDETDLDADQAGNAVIDILKNGVSVCSATKPALVVASTYSDTTLTAWARDWTKGDLITLVLTGPTLITWLATSLLWHRT